MDNSGHWLPNQDLLWQCGQIFLAEVAIDVAKHAVVGKFNEIRPGVYREFMKVIAVCMCVCVRARARVLNSQPILCPTYFVSHHAYHLIIDQVSCKPLNRSSNWNFKSETGISTYVDVTR